MEKHRKKKRVSRLVLVSLLVFMLAITACQSNTNEPAEAANVAEVVERL